jgi:hypothetical protein
LLLVGMPRSGTTWSMRVLDADPSLYSVMEPDNEVRSAPAIWAKRRTGRFPVLQPGDRNDEYRWLWSWVMDGAPTSSRLEATRQLLRAVRPGEARRFYQGRWAPLLRLAGVVGSRPSHRPVAELADRRLLVKTVYLPLAVEWVAAEFDVQVLVLRRHPGNVLASWISLDLNDRHVRLDEHPSIRRQVEAGSLPPPGSEPLERLVWQIGVLNLGLEAASARHPEWVVRTHEELCLDPSVEFRRLYGELGLTWSETAESYLVRNNRPGEGFPTQRVASDQPEAWKSRLTAEQIDVLQRVLSRFPLSTWSEQDFVP